MIWACPVCRQPLQLSERGLVCAANHSFDRAKQGYYNLLLANQKSSKSPGDDAAMLQNRHDFLRAAHYQPLADALASSVKLLVSEITEPQLLDTGCGEGYYLSFIQEQLNSAGINALYAGSDIAKDAAKLAARFNKRIEWAVASSFNLPVQSDSVDLLLRVFAPGEIDEVIRVLKPQSYFVRVVPDADHLLELKQALYDQVKHHQLPETPDGFELLNSERVTFKLELTDNASVRQLLTMTPFCWRGKREVREQLQAAEFLQVTADFQIQCYQLIDDSKAQSDT